jgi:hypothetical protein
MSRAIIHLQVILLCVNMRRLLYVTWLYSVYDALAVLCWLLEPATRVSQLHNW